VFYVWTARPCRSTAREYQVPSWAQAAQPADRPADRFDALFRRFYAEVYGLACSVLGDQAETEDTVQEAFVKLVDAPVLQRPDAEVAAWLRRVCLNLSFNRLRGQRRNRERLERVGRLEVASPAAEHGDPSGAVLRQEARAEVRRALALLPERQRNCLMLRYSGYSYAEVAETAGIAIGSVGVLLARAERAFREAYQECEGEWSGDDLS
jgi:RNA polymerase sigma factor (sigma-70 family)